MRLNQFYNIDTLNWDFKGGVGNLKVFIMSIFFFPSSLCLCLRCHMANQIDQTAGVAEFIVVPADQFDEVRVQRNATKIKCESFFNVILKLRIGIENGRIGAAQEVG